MLLVLIYKIEIVHLVLCGYEIWFLISRKKNRLRGCEGRGVGRMFGVRGREVGTEGCRRLCSELHVCYCLV